MKLFYILLVSFIFAIDCNGKEIIDLNEGLTLALISNKGQLNTLVVLEDNGESVKAVNLSKISGITGDIPTVYQSLGHGNIVSIVVENQEISSTEYSYKELLSPAGTGQHHIGLGLNYAKHAGEVNAEEQPFLFLKTIQATRQQRLTTNSDILLDYEVEICARPLKSIDASDEIADIPFGFFICGDFTDRADLMRNIDLDNMQSGAGFSNAKSRPGCFPTGPYMVVPTSKGDFIDKASFTLLRNDIMKQSSSLSKMTWSFERIIEQTFLADASKLTTYSNRSDKWLPGEKINSDMVFLTGTPEGVIMRPPSLWIKMRYGLWYFMSGAIFKTSLKDYVIENYVEKLKEKEVFLQPGERITMLGKFMGKLELAITEE